MQSAKPNQILILTYKLPLFQLPVQQITRASSITVHHLTIQTLLPLLLLKELLEGMLQCVSTVLQRPICVLEVHVEHVDAAGLCAVPAKNFYKVSIGFLEGPFVACEEHMDSTSNYLFHNFNYIICFQFHQVLIMKCCSREGHNG